MAKYVNAYKNYDRHKVKPKEYVDAYAPRDKNTGGLVEGIGYTAGKLGLGLGGVVEGAGDIVAAGGDLIRGDTEMAAYRFKDNQTAEAARKLDEWYNPGTAMKFAGDVASGIGQSSTFLLDAVAPGLGTGLFFAGVGGQNVASAAEQTGEVGWKEIGYGAASAGLEAVVGKAIGAGGQATKQIGGAILKSTGKTAVKKAAQTTGKGAIKNLLIEMGKASLGEAAEEFASEYADTGLQLLFGIDPNASTSILEAGYAALVGAFSGGLMTAGPAAINYNQSVKAGRAVRDAGEVDLLLARAKNAVGGARRAETRLAGEKIEGKDKYAAEDNVFKRGVDWNKATFGVNRRVKQESKQARQIRETLEKNIQGYESLSEDVRNSDAGNAYLGELLGNVYLLENAYRVDLAEELMVTADPAMKQEFVNEINEVAKQTGQKKSDYTVEDLDNDTDGIRRGFAARAIYEAMLGRVYGENDVETDEETQEGTKKPVGKQEGAEGQTVTAEEKWVNPGKTEDEAILYDVAHSMGMNKIETELLLSAYNKGIGGMDTEGFARAFAEGVTYGKYNIDPAKAEGKGLFSTLSEEDKRQALQAGRISAEVDVRNREKAAAEKKKPAAQAGKKGTVVRGEGLNVQKLSDEQYAAYKGAEVLAEVLGTEIVIENSIEERGHTVNGYFSPKTNRIHININALRNGKNIALYTLGHEVTHYIKEWSPTKFEALADFVLDQMGVDAETAIADKLASLKRLGIVKDTMTVADANALARDELVAEGMELVLTDGKVLEELANTDRSLWQKVKAWIQNIISKIRKYYGELNQASKTAQVLKETVESLEEIERLFTEGVREAGERTRTAGVETETRTEEEKVYSFAGEKANAANVETLSEAKRRIEAGEDAETVRKETGWFIGYDGKWRFEIDDSKLKLKQTENIPNYITVGELLHHPQLFRNYPDLAHADIVFQKLDGKYGSYNVQFDTINVEYNLKHQPEIVKKVILHELQHAIQAREGFASGASVGYWNQKIESGYDARTKDDIRKQTELEEQLNRIREESPDFYNAMMELESMTPTVPRGKVDWETLEQIEPDPPEWEAYDNRREALEKQFGEHEVWDFMDIQYDISKLKGKPGRTPSELYFSTAGEIEARNAADRIDMDQEQRKNTRPDIDREDVVFAEGSTVSGSFAGWTADGTEVYVTSPDVMKLSLSDRIQKFRSDFLQNFKGKTAKFERNGHTYYARFVETKKGLGEFTFEGRGKNSKSDDVGYKAKVRLLADGDIFSIVEDGSYIGSSKEQGKNTASHANAKYWDYFWKEIFIDGKGYDVVINVRNDSAGNNLATKEQFVYSMTFRENKKVASPVTTPASSKQVGVIIGDSTVDSITQPDGSVNTSSEISSENSSDIRYSIDETPETPDVSENRDLTDREILGMALEGAVQNEDEWKIVKSYREQAAMLELVKEKRDGYIKEANALERQIKALRARMEDEGDPDGWIRKAMDDAIAKKREAERMRDEQVKILDNADRELLRMKAAKPFREILAREQKRIRAAERRAERAEEVADRKVERAREYAEKKITREKERMEEQSKQSKERKEITIRMREARRVLGYLNTMLYHPTKQKHVPESLQALVEKTLRSADPKQFGINRDHIREMSELSGKIRKLESEAGRTAEDQKKLDTMKHRYEELEADTISVKRQAEALMTAFEQYVTSTTDGEQIDKNMLEGLRQTVTEIEEAPLNEMTLESLKAVEKIYTVIYHQIKTVNQAFATEKAAAIDEMSTKANTEVKEAKDLKLMSPRAREWAALSGLRSFLWKNMKPLTVFEAIGSTELKTIFGRVLDAEDVWITDILEAKEALDKAKKEYGYNKWDLKKRHEITTADGSKVSLTLGEMMSLYAYMFREQAEEHLSVGGFVFAPNAKTIESFKGSKAKYEAHINDQTPHRMRAEDIAKMSRLLTDEQKAYAKTVQEYLTSLGAKGNEVSRKLYGIDLFKETAYFPIKSSHDYIETSTGKSGDPNIKARGTFKETTPGASNPIVLEDFMEVVGNHVNTMATYHAFVLPVEDLTRVWNYTPVNIKRDKDGKAILDENGMPVADTEGAAGYNSLKAEITKKYGKEANDYILQLLRDLNGGARRESAASILDKGLTAFKRSATMLSLSTIVQQPTSFARAMAYIDGKYFRGASPVEWKTVKKYAPVAAIKEMGGFDTNTGARTVDYINAKQYDSIKDAAKAAVTPEIYGGDPNVRAEAFGWLTAKFDEITWRYMFGACVNEQAEKLGKPKDSEEVLKAAGKRFAEVVRHTQVYDSTLTRSELMRSKDGLMKMATAFGAEPATVMSMAAEAIIKLERGDKEFFKKTAGAIAGSIILNAVVSSVIYAIRDDEEDKNLLEKYTESVTSEIIEGFNPLEYMPVARDVMSIFKGYDIERTDMSLISNLYKQVELLTSSKRSVPDKIAGVSGAVGAFFGLPITNVYRDAKGIALTTAGFLDPEPVTGRGIGNAVGEGFKGQFGLFSKLFGKEHGNSYELYTAYVKGDKTHYDRVAARYKTKSDLEYALRRELRENDKRIVEAAEAKHNGDLDVYESIVEKIADEGIFDRNMVIRAVNNEASALKQADDKGELSEKDETAEEQTAEGLYNASDLNAAMERGDVNDMTAIIDQMIRDKVDSGKTEKEARAHLKSSVTSYWKKRYIAAWKKNDAAEMRRIRDALEDSGLYGTYDEMVKVAKSWIQNSK